MVNWTLLFFVSVVNCICKVGTLPGLFELLYVRFESMLLSVYLYHVHSKEMVVKFLTMLQPHYSMYSWRSYAYCTPKTRPFADCTSTGIHWEERESATSIWVCCSDSSSIKPQLEASNIIFWDMQSPAVSPTATFNCYCSSVNIGCAVSLVLYVYHVSRFLRPLVFTFIWFSLKVFSSVSELQISIFSKSSGASSWLGAVCVWNSNWNLEWTKP